MMWGKGRWKPIERTEKLIQKNTITEPETDDKYKYNESKDNGNHHICIEHLVNEK